MVGVYTLVLVGCGDPHGGLPQADYEKAKGALEQALTAWKKGEPATKWSAKNAPIRFLDDSWREGNALVDYQILSLRANIDGYPEALVLLTIQTKGQPRREDEALYGINLKSPNQVSIGRDPMYNK